jgi:hypothetical protein
VGQVAAQFADGFGKGIMIIIVASGAITKVDEIDHYSLLNFPWRIVGKGHIGYTPKRTTTTILMHRVIAKRMGLDLSALIEHEDRDPANNQRCNIRAATYSQNAMNVASRNNTGSKYKGVSWSKTHNKWVVGLVINRHHVFGGYYKFEWEAAIEYNKLAILHHKEFACLNVISS